MATNLIDLIDKVNADDLPTNEFTIEDTDPMVLLGKMNEVIAYLETLAQTIEASDTKATQALAKSIEALTKANTALETALGIDDKATQAMVDALEALTSANEALENAGIALSTANTALSTSNTALSTANSAEETSEEAVETAESSETKADTAISTANGAKATAEGIDAKATTALEKSQTAINTANTADNKAQEALDQVVAGLGTKVYRDSALLSNLDIKPIEDQINTNTVDIAQALGEIAELDTGITTLQNNKVDKVSGKQLSTEDFTTAEKNKLSGLNNYDDTLVRDYIRALQNNKVDKVSGKQLSTEDFTTAEKNKLTGLNNYDDTLVKANIGRLNLLPYKFYGGNTPPHDVLFSGDASSGNIRLTNKLTNYDFILVLATNDAGRAYSWRSIPVWQINYAINNGYSTIAITCGYDFWNINVASLTTTTLTTNGETSKIKEIWGLNING